MLAINFAAIDRTFLLFFLLFYFFEKERQIKDDHGKNISFPRNELRIKNALPLSTARPNRPKSYFVCFFEQTCLLYHFQLKSLTQRQQKKITVNYLLQKEQVKPEALGKKHQPILFLPYKLAACFNS